MNRYIDIGHHTRAITEKVMPRNQSAISTLVGCPPIEDGAFDLRCLMPKEIWKTIKNFPSYEISNFGNVKRKIHPVWPGRILKPYYSKQPGYAHIVLCQNGIRYDKYIHRLVLEAFVGNCPKGLECRHLDGNRKNARLDNLQWGTRKENNADKIRHGTAIRGERHGQAKLTRLEVGEIRRKYKPFKYSQFRLAREYGVSRSTIEGVVHKQTWRTT